ncbi:neuropeptide F receptor isoform X2 [Uranotaenia lowii]|uniref:neuropeptide F receptor isoform X2 n=1 Tax=Uranotaenia lowii TaxID=190385 RepID=UPI002478E1CB|nr:neuropeptide F receptor isoform X2 [Uranotaenia lowii]XP_055587680.1 neuropeptide F receptor isoform X2 [Uranotaenia lowii]XP_055587681.1 neuropeptide F receptor isoform X2 [Uranotaenia lowii]XP_055587682.1 neuropeptide F receptor isoform X2 [Uranotaenia lowii]XP_055587683.1 neuropeptide F receptor isoform X2 [Uranotaenia lowii]XP_055587684.1 neuropeptide F receptor isoform X2 [Uranotaenia lowii]
MDIVLSRFNLSLDNETIMGTSTIRQGLIEQYSTNRKVDDPAYHILIVMYGILIVFGATGNSLVVMAVARKPQMRTARNMFIVNLAVSDLLLCLVTMPLTLVEILTKYWPMGRLPFLCKSIGTLQATSIFVSTISITAIALDRYQVIVYPTRDSLQLMGAILILTGIWIFSLILASPMFITRRLIHYDINMPSLGIEYISYCIEDWPMAYGRLYYSVFTLCVQYVLPILIVSIAYLRIYFKLKHRLVVTTTSTSANSKDAVPMRERERGRRMQRTNYLLISIALIFGISWLPLNLFNLFADLYLDGITQEIMVAYAICHMMGMSSACSNPLLYGWLNDNFRKEFNELLCRKDTSSVSANANGKSTSRKGRTTAAAPEVTQDPHWERRLDRQDQQDRMKLCDSEDSV